MTKEASSGVLYIVATPIGNLEDLSARALRILGAVDVVCCEDTRHTGQLLAAKQISARRLVSLHEHNEASRVELVRDLVASGHSVAIVSDAGTPLLSDPGGRVVAACAEQGVPIVAVPGASALLAALVVAGFAVDRFAFEGFLPRKGSARSERLGEIERSEVPVVCYESPHRVAQTLRDLEEVCGGKRRVSVSRELTKLHEETWRGTLGDSADSSCVQIARGEYVVIIDGIDPVERGTDEPLAPLFEQLYAAGLARRDAIAAVEVLRGVGHRQAYDAALAVPLPVAVKPTSEQ
ncbi:MAG TPA: 16S rRNA (cytidine(1402)-2'-O)-methyltransferase [Acidimicrobiales bacterium]